MAWRGSGGVLFFHRRQDEGLQRLSSDKRQADGLSSSSQARPTGTHDAHVFFRFDDQPVSLFFFAGVCTHTDAMKWNKQRKCIREGGRL